ncbi:putative NBD/HSP70 family sugar kinase [Actinoplanes lutulentus]|uniref:Putative NBD/HSP70 family sugar kinase n=1 Tax=Actinoplanes lutulentus TaxID=1287878 RepID=A0A327ZAG2_9ACTN|nr:ROK family transcriptional regulator [Actinoplanes lutulentus]MBB2947288.1 putative NBD/HSP70 family sugar kinase [Actinoplanes lutulentus]RAK36563.1 putative NBD/HSP70 family sugar kinase [Actinoplanes lutulentus]
MTKPVHRVAPHVDIPIRQDSLRAHNLVLTFRQIVAAQDTPISRSELSTATGLTRPTISRIVDDLLAAELIIEAGPARSGSSGRPRVGLSLARTGPAGLGLDIRADVLSACVVDLTGAVRHLDFVPYDGTDPATVLPRLAAMADRAIEAAAAEHLTVVGATMAAPGPVQDNSIVRFAPTLGWRDVDAGAALSESVSSGSAALPILVGNDARLAALGEWYASGQAMRNFVCVSGEFDIGAGLLLNGAQLGGWAGELGHVMVRSDGPSCACGAVGCLQCYAGLTAILAAANHDGRDGGGSPAVAIDTLVSAGDPRILDALDEAATALGIAVAGLVNLVSVDTVLLGGSYSLLASWLVDGINRELRRRVLSANWAPIEVRPAPLGPDAAVIGAALSAVDRVREDPNGWLARVQSR